MRKIDQQDLFNLNRFLEAQEAVYSIALTELRAGKKRTHWSWYVFPQIRGLGTSAMSVLYGLSGLAEAKAYLKHPILGERLKEIVTVILSHNDFSATHILGEVDAQKLRSCLTIFSLANNEESLFQVALDKYFAGVQDPATLAILVDKD